MAMSRLEILKLLPKTNCSECGVATCLAFTMNLAAGRAQPAECPYISDAVKIKISNESIERRDPNP